MAARHHRLHDQPRHAGRHGRGDPEGRGPSDPQGQARRAGGRLRAHRGRAPRGRGRDPDRGRQRGLDRGQPGGPFRGLRGSGLRSRRAAVAAQADGFLAGLPRPVPVCADESVHDRAGLDRLVGLYDAINIKLDKTGGLTEALELAAEAEQRGFSPSSAAWWDRPRHGARQVLAPRARFVDLDGPLLLARDRSGARLRRQPRLPALPALWG